MKKGLAAVLTKAGHVKRMGTVVCELVKESNVPALGESLTGMLDDLEEVVRKFEENASGQGSSENAVDGEHGV